MELNPKYETQLVYKQWDEGFGWKWRYTDNVAFISEWASALSHDDATNAIRETAVTGDHSEENHFTRLLCSMTVVEDVLLPAPTSRRVQVIKSFVTSTAPCPPIGTVGRFLGFKGNMLRVLFQPWQEPIEGYEQQPSELYFYPDEVLFVSLPTYQ